MIQGEKPVLVDFYADWCAPCKMMKPVLEQLKSSFGDKITILKVDIDKNPNAAKAYQIKGVPTLILFKKGSIKWRQSGVIQSHELEKVINQYQ